jgi:hypothetical protein
MYKALRKEDKERSVFPVDAEACREYIFAGSRIAAGKAELEAFAVAGR